MQCPNCKSEDTKRLEIIIQEGSFTAVSKTDGVTRGTTRGAAGGEQPLCLQFRYYFDDNDHT